MRIAVKNLRNLRSKELSMLGATTWSDLPPTNWEVLLGSGFSLALRQNDILKSEFY